MLSGPMCVLRTTSGARARAVAAILALALPSCSTQYPNPFENSNKMVPPPAAAKIIFSSNTYATKAGGGLDLFAMEDTGAGVTRLTFCNTADRRCDYLEAIPGPDRTRQAVRRLLDSNGDGKVDSGDYVLIRKLNSDITTGVGLIFGKALWKGEACHLF
jgi:hypothetical protein